MKAISLIVSILVVAGCAGMNKGDDKLFVPEGWSQTRDSGVTKLSAPEKNLDVWFQKIKVSESEDFSQLAQRLWKKQNPKFSWPELLKSEPPTEKWDRIVRIVYKTPVEQNMSVLTTFKILGDTAWVTLLSANNGTLNKRGAQLSQAAVTFRPKNLKEEDLSGKKAKNFATVEKQFVEFLVDTQGKMGVPGVAVGIWQDGKVVFNKGFGTTDVNGGKPVNKDTLFMIGSVTKPLTTLMTSRLIDQGKLKWSDPIGQHLKGWKLNSKQATDTMLMKHAACACTGMPRRDLDFLFEIDGKTPEQRMKEMAVMGPTTKPGETFQYSNWLVAAGGFAAGQAHAPNLDLMNGYEKAMGDLVFEPLGMKRTYITNSSPERKNSAQPHSLDKDLKTRRIGKRIEESVNSIAPAGSIWSTTTDMLKYVELEATKGKSHPGYLSEDLLIKRREKGVKITEKVHYGMGLFIQEAKKITIVGHDGNTLGQTASMGFYPEKGVGFVILVNLQGANAFADLLTDKLFELLFDDKPTSQKNLEFLLAERKKGSEKINALIKKKIAGQKSLTGTFRSPELGKMVLRKTKAGLVADFGEWSTKIEELKEEKGKNRAFLLMSPPWNGGLALVQQKDGYFMEAAQKKYVFTKAKN